MTADIMQTSFRHHPDIIQTLVGQQKTLKWQQKHENSIKMEAGIMQTSFRHHQDIIQILFRHHPDITWMLFGQQTASKWQQTNDNNSKMTAGHHPNTVQTSSKHHPDIIQNSDIIWTTKYQNDREKVTTTAKWQQDIIQTWFKHHFRHHPDIIQTSFRPYLDNKKSITMNQNEQNMNTASEWQRTSCRHRSNIIQTLFQPSMCNKLTEKTSWRQTNIIDTCCRHHSNQRYML